MGCGPVIILLGPFVPTYPVPANLIAPPALVPATVLGVAGALAAPWLPQTSSGLSPVAGWANWWIAEVAERLETGSTSGKPTVPRASGNGGVRMPSTATAATWSREGSTRPAFRFSVLRVFDPATPTRDIDEAESHFKNALATRTHGLNRN